MALNIVWISANSFGFEMLKEVIEMDPYSFQRIRIKAIFTLEKITPEKIYDGVDQKNWYLFGVPVIEVGNINDHIGEIKEFHPDLIVVCGWRQIIKKELLSIAPKGIIGFHPALLPRGRGPAPIINTILEGLTQSGVTMYYLSEGIDDGDIIGQDSFIVEPDDYVKDIYEKIIACTKRLIRIYLPRVADGTAQRYPQSECGATYFPKRTMKDNEINLDTDSADMIYRKIRAFSKPYLGAFIVKGNKKIIIWNAELQE